MASFTDESELRLLPSHPQHQRSHTLTEADILSAQGSSNEPRNRTWTVYTSLLIISAILPVIFLILWIVLAGTKDTVFMTFSGAHIGGKFNQSQAKAVDVACSAVLASLIMTGLNYLWFGSARASTFNGQQPSDRPGIPLSALVAVSRSTSVSYDLLNIRALLRGKTRRIYLLATLTLLSAVSKTAVSNLVAYEAYSEQHSNQETSVLRYLSDRSINSTSLVSQISSMDTANTFEFSLQQQAHIANQVTGLLTGLKEGTI